MSTEVDEYLRLAEEAKESAMRHEAEMRQLLLSIADAYELLARVQQVVDDPVGIYEPDAG